MGNVGSPSWELKRSVGPREAAELMVVLCEFIAMNDPFHVTHSHVGAIVNTALNID